MWITPIGPARLIIVRFNGLWKFALVAVLGGATDLPAVDPYQPYVPKSVTNCSGANFAEQPGVIEFKDMILERIGGAHWGIFACSGYEHEEGRAWDWRMDATNPAEFAAVQKVLDWLIANEHEMARRLGLAYVIWNDQDMSFSADHIHDWTDYTTCIPGRHSPSVCHTNHVHFAFSWAGARRETTWFTTDPRPDSWYPDFTPTPVETPPPPPESGLPHRAAR